MGCKDWKRLVSLEKLKSGDWVLGAASEKERTQRGLVQPVRDKSRLGYNGQINHVTSKIRGALGSPDPTNE